ncbi:type II toxin-antitoxin system death-on-curing family toxin [Selenomonas ruminantium]|jgi:death-on-curing protein|uniref:type II toxin-antitoxin system death-on-curing family toxin n=1 Tax=Selenomonas ruminantium TaxID=971 RepID=UPI0003FE6324|nr:type II toxin-antitoxin system death-on-curing family toxin [Selenomonas ruminantium]
MIILSKQQLIAIHEQIILVTGGAMGIRDEGLLDAAIAAPWQTFGGKELFPSLEEKAARLGYGLANNHPFIDGNKRIAAIATREILALNGVELSYSQSELSDIFLEVAGEQSTPDMLLEWIRHHKQ